MLSFDERPIDEAFWYERLQAALDMRIRIGIADNPDNNTYRLVHGEGDNLPGLVVDCYGKTAVMQAHSVGMHVNREQIARQLIRVMGARIENIYYKSETTLPFKASLGQENGFICGGCEDNTAVENGLRFHVDWLRGQKTGFFVDQRENRSLLEKYAKDKTVLNMFCYTGGFSFYALRGGAKLVHSVDSSAKAIELTNANVALNFPNDTRHEAFCEDAFKFLDAADDKYDLIILDPPAFAKHRSALHNALKGYTRLNVKAFERIRHGGIHLQLFAGGDEGQFPQRRLHGSRTERAQRTHTSSASPARRPPHQHLSPRRRIPERTGSLCRIETSYDASGHSSTDTTC